jgi:hypothetical protein
MSTATTALPDDTVPPWTCQSGTCIQGKTESPSVPVYRTKDVCEVTCGHWKCDYDQGTCVKDSSDSPQYTERSTCDTTCSKTQCSALVDFFKTHFAKDLNIDCTDCNVLDVLAMMAQGDTEKAYTCAETRGAVTTRTFSNLFGFEEEYPLLWLFLTMFVILLSFND